MEKRKMDFDEVDKGRLIEAHWAPLRPIEAYWVSACKKGPNHVVDE